MIVALIGGQYGSEGKGVISAHLAHRFEVHIRTGGPNAGHTFKHPNGIRYAMQSVPCGWINPNAQLIIGRGGLIDIDQLIEEIDMIYEIDPTIVDRLHIDSRCGVIGLTHKVEEGGIKGEMHKRIGSTGKGVGAARRDRVMRDPSKFRMAEHFALESGVAGWCIGDLLHPNTPGLIDELRLSGENILLEGTQGAGLSLIHSFWPYATSQDTNAAQLCADAGIAPQLLDYTILVCRTYPIRVKGNSGPMYNEVDWKYISDRVGKETTEKTTVTKLTRRIGMWDEKLVSTAILLNKPSYFAITFMDYLDPASEGATQYEQLSSNSTGFLEYLENYYGVPVGFIGTGGEDLNVIEMPNDLA